MGDVSHLAAVRVARGASQRRLAPPLRGTQDENNDVREAEAAIVDVRAVGKDVVGGIREALKYATKATGEDKAERAAAVELALRNTRRIRIYGALQTIKCRSIEADSEKATEEDAHGTHVAACEACGLLGDWCYMRAHVDRQTVSRNGGFGLLNLARL